MKCSVCYVEQKSEGVPDKEIPDLSPIFDQEIDQSTGAITFHPIDGYYCPDHGICDAKGVPFIKE